MHLCKDKVKLAEYVEPQFRKKIREEYKDREDQIPQRFKNDLETRRDKWRRNREAQQQKKARIKNLKQTDRNRELMDTLYRWTAGPGEFGNPTRRPLLWTGTMNIHYTQNWWASEICLYMMYPFVDEQLYEVIFGLHTAIALLLVLPVNRAALKAHRPSFAETMKLFEKVIPENWHGILVHAFPHVYDDQTKSGAPALATAMYIIERVVALFNRFINDRRDPEGNLVNNLDQQTAVMNAMFSNQSSSVITEQLAALPKAILNDLGVDSLLGVDDDANNDDADDADPKTKVPTRSRHSSEVRVSDLPVHDGYEIFANHNITTVTEVHTAMYINGITRRNVSLESKIGSTVFCRRLDHTHYLLHTY